MGRLIDMERKWCESTECWTHVVTFNFDLTRDLDLDFLTSNFEIAVSQEWVGRLTWNHISRSDVRLILWLWTLTSLWQLRHHAVPWNSMETLETPHQISQSFRECNRTSDRRLNVINVILNCKQFFTAFRGAPGFNITSFYKMQWHQMSAISNDIKVPGNTRARRRVLMLLPYIIMF